MGSSLGMFFGETLESLVSVITLPLASLRIFLYLARASDFVFKYGPKLGRLFWREGLQIQQVKFIQQSFKIFA